MNFLLEQIIYFFINFIINPFTFINKINNIENLPFGREVYRIEIIDNIIYKYYRNRHFYFKNLNYYKILENYDFIPKNIYTNESKLLVVQEYKGKLLKVSDLNYKIKQKLLKLFDKLIECNIIIKDIYPLFFNRNVINNLTILNDELFIIDYGDMILASKTGSNIFYTNMKKYYNLI